MEWCELCHRQEATVPIDDKYGVEMLICTSCNADVQKARYKPWWKRLWKSIKGLWKSIKGLFSK